MDYFRLTPDTRFTPATKNAVKYWQKSLGMKQTGIIEHGRIVFSSKDVRIQAAKAKAGSAASGEIISVTGVKKEIEVFLDTSARSLAKKNTKVEVSLPGGATEQGTVRSVGTPVEKEGTEGATRKIPVTVVLDKEKAGAGLQDVPGGRAVHPGQGQERGAGSGLGAARPARRRIRRRDYRGRRRKLVPVKPGVFANGLVQVQSGSN